jgi:raffinose/stachyose/melibiose transport system permease protein
MATSIIKKLAQKEIKKPKKLKINYTFWLFLMPALFAFSMVIIIPFFIGLYYSFTDWNASGSAVNWTGINNYYILFTQSTQFSYSLIITIIYSVFNIFLLNTVSFSLALLVTRNLKFQNIYRVGFFLPNLVGGLILGYLWKFIFNNAAVALFANFGIQISSMLISRDTALLAISLTWAWQYAGYIMMIYVTAIQNIPQELIEASQIDGATAWNRLRAITLPMVAPAFTVTIFLTLINSFKQFDVNYSLTNGGPATIFNGINIWGTKLISMQIYDTWASQRLPSLAQAQAIIFFLFLTVISIAQVRFSKKQEIES